MTFPEKKYISCKKVIGIIRDLEIKFYDEIYYNNFHRILYYMH